MGNTVVIGLELQDNGSIKSKTRDTKELNQELVNTSKASKAAFAQTASRTYDQARAGGGTGAAGRDFAKESQGLGGLVRIYATFAANLFAVSAAFNALKTAADTTNLVEGLNQIGAASGRNLGSLAKQLVATTDGALSLKDAMSSTALATSGGMTNETILRMTQVAKKASIALGRDMSDSMERLTKGIIKVQPELLDELGIMTRVIPAQQAYARQLGKSAEALTSFEKQQAFTNAVLAEGEKKFSEIKIETNPYSQILASLKNVFQTGLELVNTVLTPLVGLLAKNPAGLAIALTGIGAILLKQAIPALGMYRQAAQQMADESFKKTQKIAADNEARLVESDRIAAEFAEKKFQRESDTQRKLEGLKSTRTRREVVGTDVQALTRKNIFQQTAEERAAIKSRSDDLIASEDATRKKQGNILKNYLDQSNKLIVQSTQIGDDAAEESERKTTGRFTHNTMMANKYSDAVQAASRRSILASTSETSAIMGPRVAWAHLNDEIAKSKAGLQSLSDGTAVKATSNLANGITRLSGAFSILTSYVGNALGAISRFAGYIAIAVMVYQTIAAIFSKNSAQAAEASAAFNALDDSIANAGRTMERISKLDPLEKLSTSSIMARATAMEELSASMVNLFEKATKEINSRSWFDSTTNWFAGLFGKSTEDQLAKKMSEGIEGSLKLAAGSPELQSSVDAIYKKIGATGKDANSISEALAGKPELLKDMVTQATALSKEFKKSANASNELLVGFTDLARQQKEFIASLMPQDAQAKIAIGMIAQLNKLEDALKNPIKSLNVLRDLATDSEKLGLFPLGNAKELITYGNELTNIQTQISNNITASQNLTDKIIQLRKESVGGYKPQYGTEIIAGQRVPTRTLVNPKLEEANRLEGSQKAFADQNKVLQERLTSISPIFKKALDAAFNTNAKLLESRIAAGFAQADLILKKAYAGLLPGREGIQELARLEKEGIRIQIADLVGKENLIKSQAALALAIDENTLATERTNPNNDAKDIILARKGWDDREAVLKSRKEILTSDNSISAYKKANLGTPEAKEAAKTMLPYISSLGSVQGERAKLQAQSKSVDVATGQKLREDDVTTTNRILENLSKTVDTEKTLLNLRKDSGVILESEFIKEEANLTARYNGISLAKDLQSIEKERLDIMTAMDNAVDDKALLASDRALAKNKLKVAERLQQYDIDRATIERVQANNITAAIGKETTEREKGSQDYYKGLRDSDNELNSFTRQIDLETKNRALELQSIQVKKDEDAFNRQKELGSLTEDQYKMMKYLVDLDKAAIDYAKEKLSVQAASNTKLAELYSKRAELEAGLGIDVALLGGVEVGTYAEQIKAENISLAEQLRILELTNKYRILGIEYSASQTERVLKYTQIFQSSVDNMTDGLIDFALTGKQSFGDMINSMIADLLKLEMRMMFTKSINQATGGAGIGGLLTKVLGPKVSLDNTLGTTFDPMTAFKAKGAAYDSGVETFAKGGTFTNSVVSSPTLFKFAKGTGLMGEAGPEAIMPLKRGADGSLGVEGGSGGQTSVVVNNYSTAQAETKESVDSRGNRKIEVTIGDMTAGEMARSGSASQKTMRSTFGMAPQLIRR